MFTQLEPTTIENEKELVSCRLCNETVPLYIAVEKGWTRTDKQYYCPNCKKELMKPLDIQHGI